ncbi:MAG: hypothetical protein ACTSSP_11005, partial [Candidatus Asgardarchaeia archaeon]
TAMEKGDKVYEEGIEWEGLDRGKTERCANIHPSETLDAWHLTYSKEDQGRDVYEEIIGLAVQLGMEQGRRRTLKQFVQSYVGYVGTYLKAALEVWETLEERTKSVTGEKDNKNGKDSIPSE